MDTEAMAISVRAEMYILFCNNGPTKFGFLKRARTLYRFWGSSRLHRIFGERKYFCAIELKKYRFFNCLAPIHILHVQIFFKFWKFNLR